MLSQILLPCLVLFNSLAALPAPAQQYEGYGVDYAPRFTQPTEGLTFVAGSNMTAAWDQTFPKGAAYNASTVSDTANILLGYKSENTSDISDHIYWTLATDVPLYPPYPDHMVVTLPDDLTERSTYLLFLVGSTSDFSKQFTVLPSLEAGESKQPPRLALLPIFPL